MKSGGRTVDDVAPVYSLLEFLMFGRALQRCRLAWLAEMKDARRVLLLGEGRGRFLLPLLTANPHATVDCVEESGGMILRMKAALRERGLLDRVRFIQTDARGTAFPKGAYDWVATHFFLDWLDEPDLRRLIAHTADALTPDGRWLISDFEPPPPGWRGWRSLVWLGVMYSFFGCVAALTTQRLTDPRPMLRKAGLTQTKRASFQWNFLFAEIWSKAEDGRIDA